LVLKASGIPYSMVAFTSEVELLTKDTSMDFVLAFIVRISPFVNPLIVEEDTFEAIDSYSPSGCDLPVTSVNPEIY
jgi:hypothetical protein